MLIQVKRPNVVEVTLKNGNIILFSYQRPVAVHIMNVGRFRTNHHFSATTWGHIDVWLQGHNVVAIDQDMIERVADGGELPWSYTQGNGRFSQQGAYK